MVVVVVVGCCCRRLRRKFGSSPLLGKRSSLWPAKHPVVNVNVVVFLGGDGLLELLWNWN